MGYDQYTVPDTVAVKITKVASLSNLKYKSMASRAILANFYEEQWTQNHPQYLSRLLRALFSDNLSQNSCIPNLFVVILTWVNKDIFEY